MFVNSLVLRQGCPVVVIALSPPPGCVQHDLVVLPKSTHRDRIAENAQIFDFALSADDMAELDALDRTGGTDRASEDAWW